MAKKQLYKFGVGILIATGAIGTLKLVPMPLVPPGHVGQPTPERGGGADIPIGLPLMLIAQEGAVPLHDSPGGTARALTTGKSVTGTLLAVQELPDGQWLHLLLEDGNEGWIAVEKVRVEMGPRLSFDDFHPCLGSLAGPTGPCGRSLPVPTEALWLEWSFRGLQAGQEVQRVLTINGERYAAPPVAWSGASEGRQVVNLLDEGMRIEPGEWVVSFYVERHLVSEVAIQLR